jgi:regulator of RNase E activity RraA
MLTGVNVPVRIGNATVMPGDVVFGDREGVYFVPPHLVEQVVKRAETTKIHDDWTKAKFMTGKYKSSELYPSPSDPALKKEYEDHLKQKLGKQ